MSAIGKQNQSYLTEFILLGFGNFLDLQPALFLFFLVVYMVTMTGNILVFVLVVANQHLHKLMYFFLGNLSCLKTCYTSTILPRFLASFLTGDRSISYSSCMTQFFIFAFLVGVECYLLAVISYDRYLAVCKPLHYVILMNHKCCIALAAGAWVSGFMISFVIILLMLQITFFDCNELDHFFCDFTPMIKCSCSNTFLIEIVTSLMSAACTVLPFLFTVASYILIGIAILRIPLATEKKKAFSTCSSHLIVVTIYYITLILVYMLPKTYNLTAFNKFFSVFHTVVTPMVNPLIYTLRNEKVREALGKAL
ncbi:olfactory receptor 6Z7-like [Apteryx mantelli]|uniref:Olfactory receptor n=1 Tax=Apteryx mantelli TaxID=2696672 RepID=A0A8B7ITM9_9AVES|nr:PREDICTED: olfactory receptor 5-like [Apteryx mantelli mantelli]XP_025924195.1 olfactory receptor 5-like [Apteryx rowi]